MIPAVQSFDLLAEDRRIARRARVWQVVKVALWGGVIAAGVRHRGILGLGAVGVGLVRVYALLARGGERVCEIRVGPSRALEAPWDCVDQASWESFPASDPPGTHVGVVHVY